MEQQEFMRFYEFGGFLLDSREKTLLRAGVPVALTPKVFETLLILIQNPGKLLEKDSLMDRIWRDRFVDESNLTYNIKILRKALGDNAQTPIYIENIPRRGYRFIANVHASDEMGLNGNNGSRAIGSKQIGRGGDGATAYLLGGRRSIYVAGAVLFIVCAALASWYFGIWHSVQGKSVPVVEPRVESLSITGQVFHARVSPDGRWVAYISLINERQALWMRDLRTSTNIELLPASYEPYYGLRFSNAGDYLYFVRGRGDRSSPAIYRMPVAGGIPELLVEGCHGWISLSPDDQQIGFVRATNDANISYSLMIADVGSRSEKTLVTVNRPNRISAHDWSPDGKMIAFAVGQSEDGGGEFRLSGVEVENGDQRDLTNERWFSIGGVAWLADQSGLLITGNEDVSQPARIWQVTPSDAQARPLTSDTANYVEVSVSKDASKIVATTVVNDFRLETTELQAENRLKVLSPAFEAVAHAPNGQMVFSTRSDWQEDIWISNQDGTNLFQLTNDPHNDTRPIVSPDNRYIYFASNRLGDYQVWRMNPDGSGTQQITRNEGGYPIFVTIDGNALYYLSAAHKNLWKTTIDGQTEQLVFDKHVRSPSISPDGSYLAYFTPRDESPGIKLASLDNSVPERFLPFPEKSFSPVQLRWLADGSGFVYVGSVGGQLGLWNQPITAGAPKKIADLGDEDMMGFSISPDEKTLAAIRGKWKCDAVLISGLK